MQFAKSSIFCFFVNGYFELWILPPFFFSFPFKFSWDKGGNGSSMLNCFFTVLFFFFFPAPTSISPGIFLFSFIFETQSRSVAQVGVRWPDLDSLKPRPPRFEQILVLQLPE